MIKEIINSPFNKDLNEDLYLQFPFENDYIIQISLENSFKDNVLKSWKLNEFWETENAVAPQIDASWLSHCDGSINA